MGMNSKIMTIGPHKDKLKSVYDYPEDWYDGLKEGTTIINFPIQAETNNQSKLLAKYVGISDPFDFNLHEINISKIDVHSLGLIDIDIDDIANLIHLIRHGHKAYFLPEA